MATPHFRQQSALRKIKKREKSNRNKEEEKSGDVANFNDDSNSNNRNVDLKNAGNAEISVLAQTECGVPHCQGK